MTTTNNVQQFIESAINDHQITVFAKSWCPYCDRTKALLSSSYFQNYNVKFFDLDQMEDGDEIQQRLYEMTGKRTVPSVWINGQFLGGNDETQKAWKSGTLKDTLSKEEETNSPVDSSSNTAHSNNVQQFIESAINDHQITVFAKSWCPYCDRTKALLSSSYFQNYNVKFFDLDQMEDGDEIQQRLYEMTGQRTVPSVWVNGQFLGGNDETQRAWKSGTLKDTLSKEEETNNSAHFPTVPVENTMKHRIVSFFSRGEKNFRYF